MSRWGKLGRWKSAAAIVLCGALNAACTLPYQQLNLPDAVPGGKGKSSASAAGKSGVPLSNAAAGSTLESRSYPGTGDFTAEPARAEAGEAARTERGNAAAGKVSVKPAEGAGKDSISLSIAGATVPEVAKTVLGDVLGVNYTVSDKIKATISLHTSQPVEKSELLAIFETVLRAEGVAMVVENGLYRIVPAAEANNSLLPVRRSAGGAGVSSTIVPLRYVAAAEMERILRSAAPQSSILRVDGARNILMISGTPSEQASLRDLVTMFDVDWMRGMSFAILPVDTSDPEAIAQELDTVFASNQEGPTKGMIRFVPNRRLKSVLVITSRPEYLKKAETWLKRIDMASKATEKQVHIYRAQHRPAVELAPILQKVYQAQTAASSSSNSLSKPSSGSSLVDIPSQGGGGAQGTGTTSTGPQPFGSAGFGAAAPGSTSTASVKTSGTSNAVAMRPPETAAPGASDTSLVTGAVETPKTPSGGGLATDDRGSGISVVADESRNSLVITASPSEFRRVKEVLARIDVRAAQILLEATIAEITLSNDLKFGVRWYLNKGGQNPSFNSPLGTGASTLPALPLALPTAATGFQYIMNMANLQVVLNALSAVTDVNVVSSPSLMVQENKRAQLQIGDQVPITTQEQQAIAGSTAPIINSVTMRDTGVILGITPWLADDGRVVLDIEQEVSDAVATTTSKIDSPTIQQRRVKTTVTVNNGETIVLAGFMQDRATRSRDQVPLIGNVPLLGNAFKNKSDEVKRTELLISITPQVVRDSRSLDDITSEYRDRLNFSTRPQRTAPPDQREEVDRIVR